MYIWKTSQTVRKAILYYLITPSFILGSVDNGNCYIVGKMEIKIKID